MQKPNVFGSEPSVISGMIQSFLQAVIVMVVSFDLITMTDTQQSSLQGVITSGLALGLAIWVRAKVTPTASLEYLTQEFRKAEAPRTVRKGKDAGHSTPLVALTVAVSAVTTVLVIVVLKVFGLI